MAHHTYHACHRKATKLPRCRSESILGKTLPCRLHWGMSLLWKVLTALQLCISSAGVTRSWKRSSLAALTLTFPETLLKPCYHPSAASGITHRITLMGKSWEGVGSHGKGSPIKSPGILLGEITWRDIGVCLINQLWESLRYCSLGDLI
jgi:hypothetical protein